MTLTHPKAARDKREQLAVAPLFSLETETIPRLELAGGRAARRTSPTRSSTTS